MPGISGSTGTTETEIRDDSTSLYAPSGEHKLTTTAKAHGVELTVDGDYMIKANRITLTNNDFSLVVIDLLSYLFELTGRIEKLEGVINHLTES